MNYILEQVSEIVREYRDKARDKPTQDLLLEILHEIAELEKKTLEGLIWRDVNDPQNRTH